ncbi:hypothetical protein [Acetoanaerobium sticklandii]|uniref:hypothetical protein n=1 Tax=Acetoanaerobium sticklandii TaxID=1511 RepID=UPI003A8DA3C3
MERKIISLPCGASVGGDSFVQVMAAEVSGIKSNLKLEMEVMNLHSRALVALDYEVVFYNSILEKLNNDTYSISQKDFVIPSGAIGNIGNFFIPGEFSDARKVDIFLVRGFFEDGNALDLKYEDSEIVVLEALDSKQKNLLKDKAGEDAISLAQNNDLSWRCVCGYFNDENSNVCGNCERSKTEVLEKYSSIDIFIHEDEKSDVIEEEIADDVFENDNEKSNQTESKLKEIILKFNSLEKKPKILLSGSVIFLLMSIFIGLLFR